MALSFDLLLPDWFPAWMMFWDACLGLLRHFAHGECSQVTFLCFGSPIVADQRLIRLTVALVVSKEPHIEGSLTEETVTRDCRIGSGGITFIDRELIPWDGFVVT